VAAFSGEFLGLAAFARTLAAMDSDAKFNVAPAALRKAANKVRDTAIALAPEATGRLKGAIFSRKQRTRERGKIEQIVGVRPGRKRDDQRGAFYWSFVEFGTAKQPAQPFMRPALADNVAGITVEFTNAFKKGVERVSKKAPKVRR
jgi:HK97 gp10 family phage protein